jgi:hypothetical protein
MVHQLSEWTESVSTSCCGSEGRARSVNIASVGRRDVFVLKFTPSGISKSLVFLHLISGLGENKSSLRSIRERHVGYYLQRISDLRHFVLRNILSVS